MACALLLCLAGCVGMPPAEYRDTLLAELPARTELHTVPFYAQEEYQCGPAALAMALTQAGVPRSPDELTAQVYLPQRKGSLQVEMLAATRHAGLLAYVLEPQPAALLQEVAAGHAVVVLLDQGFMLFPRWHYAVLIGYDLGTNEVLLHSGKDERSAMTLADFDRVWAKGQRWAFVALPPEQLPASATEAAHVAASVALERAAPEAANRAYAVALERWPANLLARMGLGNAAYRRQDLAQAEAEYRRATLDHPEAADAWNNLAQVLHEQGRGPAALQAAERALALGGPRRATYAETHAAIAAAAR